MTIPLSLTQRRWAMAGVGITSFMGCMDFTIVNTALPAIHLGLNAEVAQLQWLITGFIMGMSSLMVIMSRLADLYGRRRMLYIGMWTFGIASFLAGYASHIDWLIACRILQGIACAIIYPVAGTIVSTLFPPEEKGRAMGLFFGMSFVGLAIGPVLGGFVVGALGWNWIFWINVPIVFISFLICAKNVPESCNESMRCKLDYPGALLLISTISSLVLWMTNVNAWGWLSLPSLTLSGLFIVSSISLYLVEKHTKNPIIQLNFFLNRIFLGGIVGTFFVSFFYSLGFFLMPLYLQMVRRETDYEVGMMLLSTSLTVALISPIAGKYLDRYNPRYLLLAGFVFLILSALMQTYFTQMSSIPYILIAFILMGMGWGVLAGPATVVSINAVEPQYEAGAMGTSMTLHNAGGILGMSLGTAVYQFQIATHHTFISGYQGAMWLLVVSSVVAFLLILYYFSHYKKLTR